MKKSVADYRRKSSKHVKVKETTYRNYIKHTPTHVLMTKDE